MYIYNWKKFNETREPFNILGKYKNVYASKSNHDIVIKKIKRPYEIDKLDFELKFYKDYPNICAKIYKVFYKKGIIIQEKLDISMIKYELDYLTKKFNKLGYDIESFNFIKSLIKNPNLYFYTKYKEVTYDTIISKFQEKRFNKDLLLFNKWFEFIKQVSEIDPIKYKKKYLDFHSGNIGKDKEGNLKLLDI